MTSKLLPFTGADFATMEALRLNTVSHICETHLSGGIEKTNSAGLRSNLTDNPHLFAKLDYLAKHNKDKQFHSQLSCEQRNAVPLLNSDMNLSRRF